MMVTRNKRWKIITLYGKRLDLYSAKSQAAEIFAK